MRRQVAGPVRAYRGQTVAIHASIGVGLDHASLSVFSGAGPKKSISPAPHISADQLEFQAANGKPVMVRPMSFVLHSGRRNSSISFRADDDCYFYVFQNVSGKSDKLASVRIKSNDRFKFALAQAIRWVRGKFQRRSGNQDVGLIRTD